LRGLLLAGFVIGVAALSTAAYAAPSPNATFIARAEGYCLQANRRIHALPAFPFTNFDPLHPDPRVLRRVGQFFMGPGNEVPIARRLERQLRALGNPASNLKAWRAVLSTFHEFVAVIQREAVDASRADVNAWVRDVKENRLLPGRLSKASAEFGARRCAILK
jgi:hypothetical protein